MEEQPRCIVDVKCRLGEGPLWSSNSESLYWVDILAEKLYCYRPHSQKLDQWSQAPNISSVSLIDQDSLRTFLPTEFPDRMVGTFADGVKLLDFPNNKTICTLETNMPNNRINDGAVDPHGNLWFGTMDKDISCAAGSFYCLRSDGQLLHIDQGPWRVTNGPAFDVEGRYIYLVLTEDKTILKGRLKPDGKLEDLKPWIETDSSLGFPDGPIIDEQNHLWVAHWGGGCISRYTPEGKLERRIFVPAPQVTKCAFGGSDLNTLYITTAREGLSDKQLNEFPQAGGLFAMELSNIKGVPSPVFRPTDKSAKT
ncbi:MAG: SMP-30/gluconolactonase/LRE family protein [Spirochaetaceae bacterium]|jgi:D-xylonolactonase|nr:SMP-30/gluconolactonase/LRE family protein [Spirochaetaceae bacterium]